MNKDNFLHVDVVFRSLEVDLPDHIRVRLMGIPASRSGGLFWDWSWGLPILVLAPVVLLLFVNNMTAISELLTEMVGLLTDLSLPAISPVLLLGLVGVVTVLVGCASVAVLWVAERAKYRPAT